MSIAESNARNAAARQKLTILGEATTAQLPVIACIDTGSGNATLGGSAAGAFKAIFGGSMQCTGIQIFVFQAGDWLHTYVQPYSGMYALPGEHHTWIPGAWPVPTLHKHDTWGAGWDTGGDKQLQQYISGHPQFKAALDTITWEWKLGMGEFDYPWALQTRPVANGYTHVAMMATGEQEGMTHQVGVVQFQRLVSQLLTMLPPNPAVAETGFQAPPTYDAFHAELAMGTLDPRGGVPETAPMDHGQTLYGWLAPHAAKKLYIGNLPPKQDGNIRRHVLAPFAQAWPIVAAVDLTIMGSAKEALVFTPTHLFVRTEGAPAFFQYTDIRAVDPTIDDDTIWLQVDCLGEIGLPCGKHAAPVHAALTALAATRQ